MNDNGYRRNPVKNRYREDKAVEVASLLLQKEGGRMNYTKLIKLMYIIEREAIARWGRPVIFDDYYSLDNGPILSKTLDNITGNTYSLHLSQYWENHIQRDKYDVYLQAPAAIAKLNRAEIKLIDEIYQRFGQMTYGQLIDWVHDPINVPEWEDPQGSRLPITIQTILTDAQYPMDEITEILEALEITQSAREMLAA